MKGAIKSQLNYAGTSKEKKEKDFLLQNTFNKILKFLSWLTDASLTKDRCLWPEVPLSIRGLKDGRLQDPSQ